MSYDAVLGGKYYLRDLIESITLEDSLDEIAYRATLSLLAAPDLPAIAPGQDIRIIGIPYGGNRWQSLLEPGVVWECAERDEGLRKLSITVYDRTIYLAKSEDEWLMAAGQTASERLRLYAKDWELTIGPLPDTRISLARNLKRSQSIYAMITDDLKETVDKGGDMYRPRMTADGLALVMLGSNATVWSLEVLEEAGARRTLEGAVTQVKVLGQSADDRRSPVLAVEQGDTTSLGTLRKILQNNKLETVAAARAAAKKELIGIRETLSVTGTDINTIRAGDKVRLNSREWLVVRVRRTLGSPGRMELDLAAEDQVRRDYYA